MSRQRLRKLLILAGWMAATLLVTGALKLVGHLDKAHVALVYVLVVLLASARVDRFIAFTLAFFTFLCFNFFFVPPHYTFAVEDPMDWLILAIYLLTAAVGAQLLYQARTLAKRETALRESDKLKDALLAAVSHDLRTPLTTIKGVASEIRHGGNAERAAVIEDEADRLNGLVNDLLDLSRIHAGAVRPALAVNTIDDLLGASLRAASGTLRGRRVQIDLADDSLLAGTFDLTQTIRVVVNLLDNAAKYSAADTPIDVRARQQGDRLLIEVLDRGPGVPPDERDRIFEPFYRPPGVPPDIRGHGLGLSIARGLAEAQGASVRFEPRAGGGSVFTLELPAADTVGLSRA